MEKTTFEEVQKEISGKDFKEFICLRGVKSKGKIAIEATSSKAITVDELMSFMTSCTISVVMWLENTGLNRDMARTMVRKAAELGIKRLDEEV